MANFTGKVVWQELKVATKYGQRVRQCLSDPRAWRP